MKQFTRHLIILILIASALNAYCAVARVHSKQLDAALLQAAGAGNLARVATFLTRGAQVNARDEQGETALMKAAFGETGAGAAPRYTAVVRLLIAKGAAVNAKDKQGQTALMSAALVNIASLKLLLDKGGEVNAQTDQGDTALLWVAHQGGLDAARLLLAHGAAVNIQNKNGETALMRAAGEGHATIVKLLLDKGAQINAQSKAGKTALMEAASERLSATQLLLARGAQVNLKDEKGWTALTYAAQWGNAVSVNLLLNKGAAATAPGETALLEAAGRRRADIVGLLLKRGANVNGRDSNGQTALMRVAMLDEYATSTQPDSASRIAQFLLAHGAAINAQDKTGATALMKAVDALQDAGTAVLRFLLSRGAAVNLQDKAGQTALMRAIYQDNPQDAPADDEAQGPHVSFPLVAQLLLEKGARVDLRDKRGKTALIIAARWGNTAIARKLLLAASKLPRSSINALDKDGKNALSWAIFGHHDAMVKLLRHAGAIRPVTPVKMRPVAPALPIQAQRQLDKALLNAADFGDAAQVKLLLDRGANLEARDEEGNTPLMTAAETWPGGHPAIVLLLASQGAQVNAHNYSGATALMRAANCNPVSVKILLQHRADAKARDKQGSTALMSAVYVGTEVGDYISFPDAVRLLLRYGADASVKDHSGRTALMWARKSDADPITIKLLKQASQKPTGRRRPFVRRPHFS